MAGQRRNSRGQSVLLGALLVLFTGCADEGDGGDLTTLDAAVTTGDAGHFAIEAGAVADASSGLGGTGALDAGGGTTGGGTLSGGAVSGGSVSGGTTGGGILSGGSTAGGFLGGGFPGGTNPFTDAGTVTQPDAGTGSTAQDAGAAGDGSDPYAEVRQVCVDTINMYRATLGRPPLTLASADLEACSDMGAQYDGEMMVAHASTQVPGKGWNGGPGRLCGSPTLGAQDACPGWGVGGFSGNATLADALKGCLAQMWAEGEPPEGVDACEQAYFNGDTKCFLTYGHWINMQDPKATQVSCGFFDMGSNKYWMNQDFVSSF